MAWIVRQPDSGIAIIEATEESVNDSVQVKFAPNVEITLGRGATDTDITFIALRNADGELCYVYPNAAQNAIVVSATKP
jgi:hypothetical protein